MELIVPSDVFKAIQKDYEVANFEIGTSVGFTIKLVQAAPIWLLFGPGIVMNGEFVDEEVEDYYPDYSGDASVDPVERRKYLIPIPLYPGRLVC